MGEEFDRVRRRRLRRGKTLRRRHHLAEVPFRRTTTCARPVGEQRSQEDLQQANCQHAQHADRDREFDAAAGAGIDKARKRYRRAEGRAFPDLGAFPDINERK